MTTKMTTKEAIKISAGILGLALIIGLAIRQGQPQAATSEVNLPPLEWKDFVPQLVKEGVIDPEKLARAIALSENQQAVLRGDYKGSIEINKENADFLLSVFWPLGIANRGEALERGPMNSYKDRAYLASTGGWTGGKEESGDVYFNRYDLINLTSSEEALVARVAGNTYRPCCDNPTIFPDCNHGAALLGALELAVSQGYNEEQLYALALQLNSLWFPNEYAAIKQKFPNLGAKEILGAEYSSYSGWQKNVASPVEGGTSCSL